ncbi:MAG: glycosyltransferase family 4 protein [Syntrophaceae bacterium]|nr:glycosyltransferase family 4 protein [Syntrophaceae bacterium]
MTEKRKNTIWVLSELYYPEMEGSGYYVTRIAEALAVRHRVRVLSVQPTYKARGIKAPTNEVVHHVRIHRCLSTTFNKDILLFRLINLLTISLSIFFNALRRVHPGDIVLVITNPPSLPFIACIISKLRNAKLILRVEDLYPDVLVATGMFKPEAPPVKILYALHQKLYHRADRIIVLGRGMLGLVKRRIAQDASHAALITHWADSDSILPLPKENNILLDRLGLSSQFVIQCSGNMGRIYDLEILVRCAKILETQENIHFLFIGAGAKEPALRKIIADLNPKNVTILPPQPHSDLPELLNACDLAAISFIRGMAGISVPSRMYNIMAAGKPILAVVDAKSELAQVIAEEQIGWIIPPDSDPQTIASTILKAKDNPFLLAEMSVRARRAAVDKYARPLIMQKHNDLMDQITLSDPSFLRDAS